MRLALVGGTLTDSGARYRQDSIVQMIRSNAAMAVNPNLVTVNIFPITSTYGDPGGWQTEQDEGNTVMLCSWG